MGGLAEALHQRRSVRAFLDRPVERPLLEQVLADAAASILKEAQGR